mmetsp:Transcript_26728/g.40977  ORF Transcript_26728/g.40977 Transcript_26728/m.40977 type:complete len:219 (-) Transcript_26728:240-896(-)
MIGLTGRVLQYLMGPDLVDEASPLPGWSVLSVQGKAAVSCPLARYANKPKLKGATVEQVAALLYKDWAPHNKHKGYFITGKLNATLYKDDCVFDGPDPDMPVQGIQKFASATSQIFDARVSTAKLTEFVIKSPTHIEAKWRLKGTLRLPWHPELPTIDGTTTYYLDPESMLVQLHYDTWSMGALEMYVRMLFPGKQGNKQQQKPNDDDGNNDAKKHYY